MVFIALGEHCGAFYIKNQFESNLHYYKVYELFLILKGQIIG